MPSYYVISIGRVRRMQLDFYSFYLFIFFTPVSFPLKHYTTVMSEPLLSKDWLRSEEEKAWQNL